MYPPDYLLIGHVAHDETPAGPKLGGTVSYAGGAANAIGARVAIVTSSRRDDPVLAELPSEARLHLVEAESSTIFVNTYQDGVRTQVIRSRAQPLTQEHVPAEWRQAAVVHLAPLADEVDPRLVEYFRNSQLVVTPQGWMRTWNAEGIVQPKRWEHAEYVLPLASIAVFSEEDIGRDPELEWHYARLANILAVTRAAQGCTIYRHGARLLDVPAPVVEIVDATGAGDIFAGVFACAMKHTNDLAHSAEAATQLASRSVTRPGLQGLPTRAEVEANLKL